MLDSTKEKTAQIKDEIIQRTAEGTAQGAEKIAEGTRKTAESARAWADGLNRSDGTRKWTFAGLGLLVVLVGIAIYLMSSKGEKHREQLQEVGGEVLDKIG
jgi:hypothetical protein